MQVLVLTGSPHPKGTTACLADAFSEGAAATGHDVVRFDTAQLTVRPCLGCEHCNRHGGVCVHEDDMRLIEPALFCADVIAFVTPLYYFDMTAQLKCVVDRMYAPNEKLRKLTKRVLLIAAGADTEEWIMNGVAAHMDAVCRYMHWELADTLLVYGAAARKDVENTKYETAARELGRAL